MIGSPAPVPLVRALGALLAGPSGASTRRRPPNAPGPVRV